MLDASGRYHCFGCGADGDSIDLYARLYGVDKRTAARELAGDHTMPRSAHAVKRWKPSFLDEPDDEGFTWGRLCTILHESTKAIDEAKPDSDEFWQAVAVHAEAENRLENLLAGEEYKTITEAANGV